MADNVHNTWTPENLNLQTPSCPTGTAVSALGGNPHSISGTGTPVLSNLWIQPPISHLPAQLTSCSASIQSYLPPGAPHLQSVHGEQPHLPTLAACNPTEWRGSDPSQAFYTPLPPQYRNLPTTSSMEQIYRRPHLQHLPSAGSEATAWAQSTSNICLRLVQRQPLRHRATQPASLQDESYLYNHGTLALIPLGERNAPPQTGRSVPVLPSPTSQVVLVLKEVEPQISETTVPAGLSRPTSVKASHADSKEVRAPDGEQHLSHTYHLHGAPAQPRSKHYLSSLHQFVRTPEIPLAPASSLQSDFENIPHILPGLQVAQASGGDPSEASPKTDVPQTSQDPLLQRASKQAHGKYCGLNVMAAHIGPEKNHQSPPSQPEGEGTLLTDFMDEFHVPQELLTEFPDFEQLISSIEPLLPESLFPCPDSKDTTGGTVFQERFSEFSLPENAVGAGLAQCDRDQSQDLPCLATGTLGTASDSEPHVDPSRGKLSPMPGPSGKEEAMQVIDLCNSDEERQEVTGGQHSDSSIQLHTLKELGTNLWSRINDKLQGLKAIITGRVLVPRSHQESKQDIGTMKSFGNKRKSNNGQSKDQGEGKLKTPGNTFKRKGVSPGSPPLGKSSKISVMAGHILSSDSAVDPTLPKLKGKRKTPLAEQEPSPKKSQITLVTPMSKLPHLQRERKMEEKQTKGNVSSEIWGKEQLLQNREEPWKRIHAMAAADASKIKSIPCLLEPLPNLTQAKRRREVLTITEDTKAFLPELPLQGPSKLHADQEGSTSRHLQMGHDSSVLEKIQSKTQYKGKASINISLSGMKSKKRYPKIEAEETPKPVPRTNLALQMMESVQVLYPLGKSNVSSMPSKKVHPVPSYNPVPENLITKAKLLSRPLVNPSSQPMTNPPLQPQYKPPSFSVTKVSSQLLSRPSSHHLPKPHSHPWQKLPPLPEPTQPPKPLWKQMPHASVLPVTKPLDSQLHNRGWRTQAGAVGTTTHLVPKPPERAPNLWQPSNLRPSSNLLRVPLPEDPSSSPPYEGATFIPWRTPPHDLEVSEPISDEQRPLREQMKREAQKEREEAACWTSAGRIKHFVEREKEMDISLWFGYPKFGCPWR